MFGWEDPVKVDNISRDYVSDGVRGSTAVQVSAEFLDYGAYIETMIYQNGYVLGSERATTENTQLSFDVKVDRPGLLDVTVALQNWHGFIWNWFTPSSSSGSSVARIPLGAYTPGRFKTLVISLDDPRWVLDPYGRGNLFNPSAKTYQMWVQVDSGGLPAPATRVVVWV